MNYDALLDTVLDSGYLPQAIIRMGCRRQVAKRIAEIASPSVGAALARKMKFIQELKASPIAIETAAANKQHYEIGTEIMAGCLGPRMKYSCALFAPGGKETLAEAETAMLRSYVEKMGLKDGMRVLDMGCGWGSGVLFLGQEFPNSSIVGFSNSRTQKEYIDKTAKERGLTNIEVITGNAADYEFEHEAFDRVLSVEMMEHMKNYEALLAKVSRALKPGGKFLVHVFAHKDTPYHFEEGWMTTHFFTGGTMPSVDLLLYFQRDLTVVNHWWLPGTNYAKTLECWLSNWLKNKKKVWPALIETYGEKDANAWFNRWSVFHMASAEMFGYGKGEVWGIIHLLYEKPQKPS
ncbi:S-adenosyl-L-methionine-dependent methyltransferase [Cercophora scortea]|uniref:S-adenosyl-L-methionine-dependent methyltransferase n=1 Tax=Cercophora scortea TaxID=314031 RepID=A0AAE0INX6_9PEZI|nr:S-adenosyl-L-methionine-dependent methyltransferase [Cercophora scortea]